MFLNEAVIQNIFCMNKLANLVKLIPKLKRKLSF